MYEVPAGCRQAELLGRSMLLRMPDFVFNLTFFPFVLSLVGFVYERLVRRPGMADSSQMSARSH